MKKIKQVFDKALYVCVVSESFGPEETFVEIETEEGKSVSVPSVNQGRGCRIGPLFRHPFPGLALAEDVKKCAIEKLQHVLDVNCSGMSNTGIACIEEVIGVLSAQSNEVSTKKLVNKDLELYGRAFTVSGKHVPLEDAQIFTKPEALNLESETECYAMSCANGWGVFIYAKSLRSAKAAATRHATPDGGSFSLITPNGEIYRRQFWKGAKAWGWHDWERVDQDYCYFTARS